MHCYSPSAQAPLDLLVEESGGRAAKEEVVGPAQLESSNDNNKAEVSDLKIKAGLASRDEWTSGLVNADDGDDDSVERSSGCVL